MERPTLEYAENCTLIHTYARKLEEYCDELEKITSTISKSFSESMFKIYQLNKALDKACGLIKEAVSKDCTIFDEVNLDNVYYIVEEGELKEWLMKDE